MLTKSILNRILISASVFVLTTLGSVGVWWKYADDIQREQAEQIRILGEHTRSRIWSNINVDIDQLENFANRLEFTDGEFFKFWREDAAQLVRLDSSIKFIEWIDSNMIIRDVVPRSANQSVVNLNLRRLDYRKDDWIKSVRENRLNITTWLELIQGGQAFLLDAPVWVDGVFHGTITGGFDFTFDIDQFFENNKDYHIHLYDHHDQLFYCSDDVRCPEISIDERYLFTGLINVNNRQDVWWKIEFYPTPSYYDSELDPTSMLSLALSIFLGLTLSIMLFFIMKTNAQERATLAINERLEKLNETLAQEKNKAEKSARVKAEFLSNMSHEIRTPLNIIQGLIQLLSENEEVDKEKEYLDLLTTSSSNLLGLLNNILDMDRIEAGLITIQNTTFKPVKKINAICSIFYEAYRQKGVDLIFETNENEDQQALGDEVKFTQIISNFLQNALKFTDQGSVTVEYEQEQKKGDAIEVIIRVRDTGIGIPQDRLSMIFERFSQLDSGYRKKYSGTGLGLSINYELVRLMGGDIVVTSTENVGTEFIITLMLKDAPSVSNEKKAKKPISDFKGMRCLIVEDNDLNVLVITKMLESLNITWHAAADGQKGVEAFEQGEFDVVLMDLHMPVMDGMEASQIIMSKNPDIPIIMLSANVTKEAIEQARDAGIEHYLTKPVSKERIVQVLNEIKD